MKPILNRLSTPPNKHERDYYSKLDVYLKNLYDFTEQLNAVIEWMEEQDKIAERRKQEQADSNNNTCCKLSEQQKENDRMLQEIKKLHATSQLRGLWSDQRGVANPPFVVYHKDKHWSLIRPVRRLEAEEPSFSDCWIEV